MLKILSSLCLIFLVTKAASQDYPFEQTVEQLALGPAKVQPLHYFPRIFLRCSAYLSLVATWLAEDLNEDITAEKEQAIMALFNAAILLDMEKAKERGVTLDNAYTQRLEDNAKTEFQSYYKVYASWLDDIWIKNSQYFPKGSASLEELEYCGNYREMIGK